MTLTDRLLSTKLFLEGLHLFNLLKIITLRSRAELGRSRSEQVLQQLRALVLLGDLGEFDLVLLQKRGELIER